MSKYNKSVNNNFSGDNNGKIINGDNIEINNMNVYNITIPKRLSNKEKQEKEKLTKRPCLKDKLGQKITCFGYIVGRHKYLENLITVINVVDISGEFAADHIQLDFKEDIYDYTYDKGTYIRFTGIVKSYIRKSNNTIDYTIDINKKVMLLPSEYDLLEEPYINQPLNINIIDDYIRTQNITKIHDIINKMRKEINELTNGLYFKDYLYYYAINQYMLNQATYAIYQGEIRDHNLNEDCVIGLLILIGSLLYKLKTGDSNLGCIMNGIATDCNILQGVEKYTKYEDNPNLKLFYEENISINNQPVGKKILKYIFNFVCNRFYDFNQKEPNENNDNIDNIKIRAYHMIQQYII